MSKNLKEILTLLGERIRALRTDQGLSQATVAERTGTDQGQISLAEQGKLNLTLDTLTRIASALGVRVKIKLEREGK